MRVGVKSGPLSVSGRPFTSPTVAWIGTFAIAWAVLDASTDDWYVSIALAAVVGSAASVGARIRRIRTARAMDRQQEQVRSWLAAPAPPLTMPSRFSYAWLSENVPDLHPGQIDPLVRELTSRGWKPARIVQRLGPLLVQNSAIRARLRPDRSASRAAPKTPGATLADIYPRNGDPMTTADRAPTVALARSLPAGASATVGGGSLTRASTEHASSRRGVACEP